MSTTTPQNESQQRRRAACERLKNRLRTVHSTRVEHLLIEEPELADDDDALLELILVETAIRRELGDVTSVDEWEQRIRDMIPDPRRRRAIQGLLSTEMTTLSESSATTPPLPLPGWAGSANITSLKNWAGAGWASSTRPASSAPGGSSPSR
ncbi:hypothetical protein [Planctomyces sp. SH-PL62]|uniref:hypothetical protein n=1 Tax=Planctomyces sp. SH-PL62 TaxID=1636152 RepID=UPI00078D43A6|nr:hypothetical protein [Planctomyces sp. SH-PL62]AMV36634.1 hypothetical protein VT85_04320 [Planctomyces sp. SH-PL62]